MAEEEAKYGKKGKFSVICIVDVLLKDIYKIKVIRCLHCWRQVKLSDNILLLLEKGDEWKVSGHEVFNTFSPFPLLFL